MFKHDEIFELNAVNVRSRCWMYYESVYTLKTINVHKITIIDPNLKGLASATLFSGTTDPFPR